MNDEVFMEVPAVRTFSKNFQSFSEILENVSKVLEALMTLLKTTAFIGLVGGTALLMFLEQIKPVIDQLAEKCAEISQDLTASVDAYERGDALGAARFH